APRLLHSDSSVPPLPHSLFLFTIRPPHRSTLFPYTTLFRSCKDKATDRCGCTMVHPGQRGDLAPIQIARRDGNDERRCHRAVRRSEEHTSELQSRENLVCRLLLEKKNEHNSQTPTKHADHKE